jgi:6-phospho-3-hexuloisomerase
MVFMGGMMLKAAIAELGQVADAMDAAQVEAACQAIAGAKRIMVFGCGREGVMLRAFAMRLHHLGLRVCMQGDMTAFPLGAGDLFLCAAGPGDLPTVDALVAVAKAAGAKVLMVTAQPGAAGPARADALLVIPAQTMANDVGGASVLPMGSLFEGALFLVCEVMVLRLAVLLGQDMAAMRARHTNME